MCYFRKSLHDLEKVLSLQIVMFHQCGVVIVYFLSHLEESVLHRTIIFLTLRLHVANRYLTLMFTTVNYLRGHVVLDSKSPEPQVFGSEGTLGILFVPTTRVFPDKVCRRNCSEE